MSDERVSPHLRVAKIPTVEGKTVAIYPTLPRSPYSPSKPIRRD